LFRTSWTLSNRSARRAACVGEVCLVEDRERVADILRLSGGALAANPDDEPDRERVRDRAAEARRDEGKREPVGVPGDGLQTDGGGIKGWRSLNGSPLLVEVIKGTVFIDGIREQPPPEESPNTALDITPA
jgi:hypothetical protein